MELVQIFVFLLCLFLGILSLFLTVFLAVQFGFWLGRRADRKQQAEYEQQEWERHVGKERATLLRAANIGVSSSDELLRAPQASPDPEAGTLLRIPEIPSHDP